jgi:protein-S-isoprenylcysteine O-methyltransferase Ste14
MTTGPDTPPPSRFPWPPTLLAAALASGLALHAAAPVHLGLPRFAGWVMVAAALALDVSAVATLRRAETTVMPHRAAARLVRTGPFAWSRNPIYVGNTLALAGLGVALDTAWLIAAALVMAALVHRLAVLPEERHLARRFGPDWEAYARSTPRWIGLRGG